MKFALVPLLPVALALVIGAAHAPGALPRSGRVEATARGYVRLSDWAGANNFEVHWLKRGETLRLANPTWRLVLAVDSREAEINGVQVWLLFPVVQRDGAVYLAQVDVEKTLRPILSPRGKPRAGTIRTICVDPGHGGRDPGNRVGSTEEKKYTLLLAQELRQQLTRAGFRVAATRSADSFVDLPVRPALAGRRNADLFISLHFNGTSQARGSVQGAEVYCLTPAGASSTNARGEGGDSGACVGNRNDQKNLLLAYRIQHAMIQSLAVVDRGVRRARFAVLRDAAMPAVLVEAGFLSHPTEGRKILTATYRRQIARAIVTGVEAYRRVIERGD